MQFETLEKLLGFVLEICRIKSNLPNFSELYVSSFWNFKMKLFGLLEKSQNGYAWNKAQIYASKLA